MITTRLYLDLRAVSSPDTEAPIKLQINKRGQTALLSTGVKVLASQWDKPTLKIVKHPTKSTLNTYLLKFKLRVDDLIQEMTLSGAAAELSATELKHEVEEQLLGRSRSLALEAYFRDYIKTKNESTASIYLNTLRLIALFDEAAKGRSMRAFRPQWAQSFADWLEKHYAANTRRQALSNMSAVFNAALKAKLVDSNPFAHIKVPYVITKKRNLSQQQFRTLWNAKPMTTREAISLDLFKFSFLTIAANPADIADMTPKDIFNGRIEYDRLKTGKHYSIKIVPELEPILAKYSSYSMLFKPFADHENYKYLVTNVDKALHRISKRLGLPRLSLYWARHSWASMAAELDIPIDVISSALGHSHGAKVTLVYINQDQKKVDDANRRVIDFALYDDIKE